MVTSTHGELVVASFNSHSDAEDAVRDLQSAGFRSSQIGSSFDDYDTESYEGESSTAVGEDQRSFWEKVKDFFSGEEHDASHSVHGKDQADWSSEGLAVPQHYQSLIDKGGQLVSVAAGDRKDEAERILMRNNGQIDRNFATYFQPQTTAGTLDTSEDLTGSNLNAGVAGSAATAQPGEATTGGDLGDMSERRIQLISEVLRVRKERVARGEVRLRKEVRTDTQTVQVPVTREEIVIERNPVSGDRPATGDIGSDSEIRVPLSEERVSVDKVPVVREEVRVGKRPVSETKNVSEQVRREELDVEGADNQVDPSGKRRKTA